MRQTPPIVLSIAGFDPSSGAGSTADLKTIAAHGLYGICCISALTVQSTQGVRRVEALPPELVRKTLEVLLEDFAPAAVKIGMLGNAAVVGAVAGVLGQARLPHIVLDPVIRSSSGAELLDKAGIDRLLQELLPLAEVITPNLAEAEALTGTPVRNLAGMEAAAQSLHELGARNVVITGGHLDRPTDLLSQRSGSGSHIMKFQGERVSTNSSHGTGCAFATALACNLANGKPLAEATHLAKEFVTQALRHAYQVGKGKAPVNHLWEWDPE